MKIFSRAQVYEGDKITIAKEGITSADLMERAGISLFNWIDARIKRAPVLFHIFCGIGNNGGDGLVLGRHLINHGYNVKLYIVNFSDNRSKDFLINYERFKQTTKDWPVTLNSESDFPDVDTNDIIIDAIFGVGLNRPIQDWVVNLFQALKASEALTIAVDMPSGLYTDRIPQNESEVVTANLILTFQSPKLVFFLPDTSKYIEQWEILDIGIDSEFLANTVVVSELIGKYEVLPLYKLREKFSHKGTFGHSLIVGGSYGKIGAVHLAAKAALKIGSGLVTAYVPKCGYIPLQTAVPELMVITDSEDDILSKIEFDLNIQAIGLGIGMGTSETTTKALVDFLKINMIPLVIDADGLNILSKRQDVLEFIKPDTVLTPHPKELKRLIGAWQDDFDKIEKAKLFSSKYKVVLIIKGANTLIVCDSKVYVNSTGNPGLATAGTGDVLTGVITGFRAQGYSALDAALLGVYLHGKSADIAVEHLSYQGLIASDVISNLGNAFLDLFMQPELPLPPVDLEDASDSGT
ncbi:NAD(P)H-hydrate dehydratase [Formosa sp. S-31]|uniref:NAD(P)H-hydrate dehydratase n=1 Tax=Formosa sp. S-31 TaxID=2790949 RepID=UPI003EB9DE3F